MRNNNTAAIKRMILDFGIDPVELAESMKQDQQREWKSILPASRYANGKVYPEWVEETLTAVSKETGVDVIRHGSGKPKSLCVTNEDFAKYIIYTCNDKGSTLCDVIDCLLSAPAWCGGYGMTRFRMELVFHILVLHRDQRETVKSEIKRILNMYDPVALKVFANADDAFRNTLNHEMQMIAFTERKVCSVISEETQFRVVAA